MCNRIYKVIWGLLHSIFFPFKVCKDHIFIISLFLNLFRESDLFVISFIIFSCAPMTKHQPSPANAVRWAIR